jgi:hypothetical protein
MSTIKPPSISPYKTNNHLRAYYYGAGYPDGDRRIFHALTILVNREGDKAPDKRDDKDSPDQVGRHDVFNSIRETVKLR